MEKLGALDIGGTSIKYGVWDGKELLDQASVPTPKTLEEFYDSLTSVVNIMKENHDIKGVGMSIPGGPDKKTGVIIGMSALPYIHHFPIQPEFEKRFGLPVSMENDANCAALAELKYGAGRGKKNLLFFILGTGVGGSVIFDGKVHHGPHLFGGEFGFMFMDDELNTFSKLGTTVQMAKRYSEQKNDGKQYTGIEVFDLWQQGDELATEQTDIFFNAVAKGVLNLAFSFDPEICILGGGVSNAPFLLPEVKKRIWALQEKLGYTDWTPDVVTCGFKSEANMIGAVVDFMQEHGE
ncbi:MAG: ROK family protein [Streptococcaceae bacterium]|nr:ROK family protein [Streptococcaceae bacterium]